MSCYYNEWDKHAAAWLRELIKAGLIPPGDVDERSITDIKPDELKKYTQCHFFAGIGGWILALRLASWPPNKPIGTGSCPCQPFSAAGKRLGNADDRHLWPAFFKLIVECRALGQRWTDTIFGEQVESAIAHGWLDSVSSDLEGEGYAVGAAVLGAHSVGAPHRRQRLYWVAYADQGKCGEWTDSQGSESDGQAIRWNEGDGKLESGGTGGSVADHEGIRLEGGGSTDLRWSNARIREGGDGPGNCGVSDPVDNPNRPRLNGEESASEGTARDEARMRLLVAGCPNGVALGDTDLTGPQGRRLQSGSESDLFETWTRGVDFIACTDGRKRLVKSSIFPLAHGFPSRVGLLRGSGNAIVPQVAATFIIAAESARRDVLGLNPQPEGLCLD